MANVLFTRSDNPESKPVTDGQLIFDTSGNGKMYLDNGTDRLEMGGALTVDATLSKTSTNPIQNKGVAGVMLDSLDDIANVTNKGFLPDALTVKELNSSLNGLSFAPDENGKWGYKVGADSVIPFSSGGTVTLTFPNQSRYADQAGTVVKGALTLSIDSDGVSIVSNNISIQTIYVQRPDMTTTWTPTVTAELI